jgi:hypothetical protein
MLPLLKTTKTNLMTKKTQPKVPFNFIFMSYVKSLFLYIIININIV